MIKDLLLIVTVAVVLILLMIASFPIVGCLRCTAIGRLLW